LLQYVILFSIFFMDFVKKKIEIIMHSINRNNYVFTKYHICNLISFNQQYEQILKCVYNI